MAFAAFWIAFFILVSNDELAPAITVDKELAFLNSL
jgi:hypothetical protein